MQVVRKGTLARDDRARLLLCLLLWRRLGCRPRDPNIRQVAARGRRPRPRVPRPRRVTTGGDVSPPALRGLS